MFMLMIRHTINLLKNVKEFKKVKWKKSIFEVVKDADIILIHTEWNEYRALNFNKIKKLS